jgi:beta-lactamase regulating signal transducer with metallopeptidase domain
VIAAWMLYAALVSVGAALAAGAAERVLRLARAPARLVWIAALAVAMLPLLDAPLRRDTAAPIGPVASAQAAGTRMGRDGQRPARVARRFGDRLRRPTIVVAPDSRLARLDGPLLALWAAGSLLTLGMLVGAVARLRRLQAAARPHTVDGVPVLVTERVGPLAVGLWRPRIVVPPWVLDLAPAERRLVLTHEREHARWRDPALLTAGAVLVGLTPWNPALWYMLRQLYRAVEIDCDRRVLGTCPDRRAYAELLLAVAGRPGDGAFPVAALTASASFLERRFRLMSERAPRFRAYRVVGGVVAAGLLVGTTAMVPLPAAGTPRSERTAAAEGASRTASGARAVVAHLRVLAGDGSNRPVRFDLRMEPVAPAGATAGGQSAPGTTRSMSTPATLTVDLTHSDVSLVCDSGCTLRVEAAFDNAPARTATATARHVVLPRGGTGIVPRR